MFLCQRALAQLQTRSHPSEGKDRDHKGSSPRASRICRSLSLPSNTLPVSLKRADSSRSRGNMESCSHTRTLSRLGGKKRAKDDNAVKIREKQDVHTGRLSARTEDALELVYFKTGG